MVVQLKCQPPAPEGPRLVCLRKDGVRGFVACQFLSHWLIAVLHIMCPFAQRCFCMSFGHFLWLGSSLAVQNHFRKDHSPHPKPVTTLLPLLLTTTFIHCHSLASLKVFVNKAPLFFVTNKKRGEGEIYLILTWVGFTYGLLSICALLTHNNHPMGHIPKAEIES